MNRMLLIIVGSRTVVHSHEAEDSSSGLLSIDAPENSKGVQKRTNAGSG